MVRAGRTAPGGLGDKRVHPAVGVQVLRVFTFVLGNALGLAAATSLTRKLSRDGGNTKELIRDHTAEAREIARQFPRLRARLDAAAAADYSAPEGSFEFGLQAIPRRHGSPTHRPPQSAAIENYPTARAWLVNRETNCQSSVRQIQAQSASRSCSLSRSLTTSSADSAPSHGSAGFSRSRHERARRAQIG